LHTNHRRKKRRSHKVKNEGRGRARLADSLTWYRRNFWKAARAEVRDLIIRERYDDIPDRYYDSILWDLW